ELRERFDPADELDTQRIQCCVAGGPRFETSFSTELAQTSTSAAKKAGVCRSDRKAGAGDLAAGSRRGSRPCRAAPEGGRPQRIRGNATIRPRGWEPSKSCNPARSAQGRGGGQRDSPKTYPDCLLFFKFGRQMTTVAESSLAERFYASGSVMNFMLASALKR
ncbi:hypothetical protein QTH97_36765, partial [Variovorax sp. J22R24]|uniref:hypothetical protein n=1 Tax=Variovorax gracilis TaxID=3053502 RepID=UPI002576DFBB